MRSRSRGKHRAFFYGCGGYNRRGHTVCTNNLDVPLPATNEAVLAALLEDILDEAIVADVVRADEGGARRVRLAGKANYGKLLAGVVDPPTRVASPTGPYPFTVTGRVAA